MKYILLVLFLCVVLGQASEIRLFPETKREAGCYLFGMGTAEVGFQICEFVAPTDGNWSYGEMFANTFAKILMANVFSGCCSWLMRNHFRDDADCQWVRIGKGHQGIVRLGITNLMWLRLRARDRARVPKLELLGKPYQYPYGDIQPIPYYGMPSIQWDTMPYFQPAPFYQWRKEDGFILPVDTTRWAEAESLWLQHRSRVPKLELIDE